MRNSAVATLLTSEKVGRRSRRAARLAVFAEHRAITGVGAEPAERRRAVVAGTRCRQILDERRECRLETSDVACVRRPAVAETGLVDVGRAGRAVSSGVIPDCDSGRSLGRLTWRSMTRLRIFPASVFNSASEPRLRVTSNI